MKTSTHLLVLACLLTSGLLRAADLVPLHPSPASPAAKEMAALEHFLDLTDDDLDQMQRVIARIRAMGADERAALRREMEKYCSLPDGQRRQLRLGWGALEDGLQDAWQRMMQSATPARRAEIQTHMQALPPEKKAAYRRQLAEEFLGKEAKK
jgi:hypothetical protein